jgi:NAD(P)-dependent dehydrogenase (short-subunit alcohol dehydrogenase family)
VRSHDPPSAGGERYLTSKTAVVTGAGRGIGLATVQALIGDGVRVVGAARTITPELTETGACSVEADLSTAAGVATLMSSALAELGGIDLLVNNVGGGDDVEPAGFLDTDDTRWARILNLLSAVRTSRAALPGLIEGRRGDRQRLLDQVPAAGRRPPSPTARPRPPSPHSESHWRRSSDPLACASTPSRPELSAPPSGRIPTAWAENWLRWPAQSTPCSSGRFRRHFGITTGRAGL